MNYKAPILFAGCLILATRSFASAPEPYHALRINQAITLDGKMDEASWAQAELIDDFMQTDPLPGGVPTERTETRIAYDDEYLYVGIKCFDSDPNKIIRLHLDRDFGLGEDDGTGVILDTYHDDVTSVIFVSNTLNARWDAQGTGDGSDLNASYNTFWDAVTSMESFGYSTEYRIPFSSLRFEAKPVVTMGFRIARLIKRKNELITYPKMDPQVQNGWANSSYAREIVFENLKSHTPFYISPYVIANYAEQNTLNADGTAYEKSSEFMTRKNFVSNEAPDKILSNVGVDAKYGLSKNFTLDLTLNTDFAQAEVDNRIINLSKYNVNLPEKRVFFLESSNNLSYGFPTGNEIFISRSIGNEDGIIVPILGGARITGKSNGWQIGTLDMQTTNLESDSIHAHNFFVFRTRKDIDKLGSFVGGIITNRINTDSTHESNQCIGLDFVKRFNQQWIAEGGMAGSMMNADFSAIGNSMYYDVGAFRSTNNGFFFSTIADVVGKDFNPVMGYLDEPDHVLLEAAPGYQWKAGDKSKAEYWYAKTTNNYRWIMSTGKQETFYSNLVPGVTFKSGADINVSLFEYKIDSLTYDWYLDDHNAIAAGTYKMFDNSINITSPQKTNYFGTFTATYGGFYGGTRIFISPDITYHINRHFHLGLTYEFNRIALPHYLLDDTSTVYQTNLVRVSFSYLINTKLSFKIFTQYDDLSNSISSNLRFRFNPHEGTDLYIVINQGLNTARERLDPHLPFVNTQAVTVKFVKTFGA